jgi:hypothetical protein
MVERTRSDDSVAAVLRRAVGNPTSDLNFVLTRGSRARSLRARRSYVMTSVTGLAAMILLLMFIAHRSQPSTPQPAGVPRDSRSALPEGTYSTRPLKLLAPMRDQTGHAGPADRPVVFTLQFRNGTYRELQAADGGPPHLEDAGTYYLVGSTITLNNNIGQTTVLEVHRTIDGFNVAAAHFECECQNERRIAGMLHATGAALHINRTH